MGNSTPADSGLNRSNLPHDFVMENAVTYHVKPSAGLFVAVLYLLLFVNPLFVMILIKPEGLAFVFLLVAVIAAGTFVVGIILIIVMHRKPGTLHIYDSSLELFGRRIEGAELEAIWIRGYFRPNIGLKRLGSSKVIPPSLCFKMKESRDEDACMAELELWAKRHDIPIKHRFFRSGI